MLGYNSRIRHKIGKFNRRFSGDLYHQHPATTRWHRGIWRKLLFNYNLSVGPWSWVLGTAPWEMYYLQVSGAGQYVTFWHWQPVVAEKGCFFTINFFLHNPKHSQTTVQTVMVCKICNFSSFLFGLSVVSQSAVGWVGLWPWRWLSKCGGGGAELFVSVRFVICARQWRVIVP